MDLNLGSCFTLISKSESRVPRKSRPVYASPHTNPPRHQTDSKETLLGSFIRPNGHIFWCPLLIMVGRQSNSILKLLIIANTL